MTTRFCFCNPDASGWARAKDLIRQRAEGAGVDLVMPSDWDQAVGCISDQGGRILVCGGDGTLSQVVNLLDQHDRLRQVEIALLPLGTGNDFARSIGLANLSLGTVFDLAINGKSIPMDLIQVRNGCQRIIVNGATAGFGDIVAADVTPDDKTRWGAIAYWITAFTRLTTMQEYSLRLEIDGEEMNVDAFGLAITSGRYVGGGFPVSPQAFVNDGALDVTIVPVMPIGDILAAGVDFSLGRPSLTERIKTRRAKSVRVAATPVLPFSLDGESNRSFEAIFNVLPGAVSVVTNTFPPAVRMSSPQSQLVVPLV